MRVTRSAETRNVAAFTANAQTGDPSTSRRPPKAGPSAIAALVIEVVIAFAAASSSSRTIRGTDAATHGPCATEKTAVRAESTIAATAEPVEATTHASAPDDTARKRSDAIMTFRRGRRSAIVPPIGASATYGRRRAVPAAATHPAEPVSASTKTIRARLASHSPTCEVASPPAR